MTMLHTSRRFVAGPAVAVVLALGCGAVGALAIAPAASAASHWGETADGAPLDGSSSYAMVGGTALRSDFFIGDTYAAPAGGIFLDAWFIPRVSEGPQLTTAPEDVPGSVRIADRLPMTPGVGVTLTTTVAGLLTSDLTGTAPAVGLQVHRYVDAAGDPVHVFGGAWVPDPLSFGAWPNAAYVVPTCHVAVPAYALASDAGEPGSVARSGTGSQGGCAEAPTEIQTLTGSEHVRINPSMLNAPIGPGTQTAVVTDAAGGVVGQHVWQTAATGQWDEFLVSGLTAGIYTVTWASQSTWAPGFAPMTESQTFRWAPQPVATTPAPAVIDHAVTVPVGTAVSLDLLTGSSLGGATEWVAVGVDSADSSLGLTQGDLGAVTMLPTIPGTYTITYRAVGRAAEAGDSTYPTADCTVTVTVVAAPVVEPPVVVPPVVPEPEVVEPEPVTPVVAPEPVTPAVVVPVAEPVEPAVVTPPDVRIETGLPDVSGTSQSGRTSLAALGGLLAAALGGLAAAGRRCRQQ